MDRAGARRQGVRDITRKVASDFQETAAVQDFDLFIKKPTVYKTRRPEDEKPMVLRTSGLLYSGHHPGLRLGAAIALSGYSKTDFGILQEHARSALAEERSVAFTTPVLSITRRAGSAILNTPRESRLSSSWQA